MLSNWGFDSSTGEDFPIGSDPLTDVVLPDNTFSVDSLLLPFLVMKSFFACSLTARCASRGQRDAKKR